MNIITLKTTLLIFRRFMLSLTISVLFVNCDSEEDVNLDTVFDPCESAIAFGLNTYDPWSGGTPLFTNADFGSDVETAPAIGGSITYSNASTYNFVLENYHFFNSSNNLFVNVIDTSPATMSPLVGAVVGSTYSHIVYVKGTETYYMIENASEIIKLAEVNPMTGALTAPSGETGYIIPAGGEIKSISITTNNIDEVYIGINNTFIKMDVSTPTPTSLAVIALEAPSTNYLFHGLEYNSVDNNVNAVLTNNSDEINLVHIALPGTYELSYDLSLDIPNNPILQQFYSTTLSCDETHYKISYLDGNNSTYIQDIDMSTGETLTTYREGEYYFGIESNANN